ncbi:hypothetical protein Trydic_g3478 [Trypoxylus dichotomus]
MSYVDENLLYLLLVQDNEMGGKSSKTDGLVRAASFRRSQKNTLQKIERKLNRVSKDIEKFKGTIDDNKYTKIKQNITEVIDDLEKINPTVKDKHKDTYQTILDKCHDELQKLDDKVTNSPSLSPAVSPVASPTPISPANDLTAPLDSPMSERSGHSVQVKLIKFAFDAEKQKPPSRAGTPTIDRPPTLTIKEETETKVDLEAQAVATIDAMRKKIEYLETEIHMYKKNPDENLYGFIRESLNQIIVKLDVMETFGNIQIRHERKLALQRAQECLKYLNDDLRSPSVDKEPESETESAVNDKTRLSNRSMYRPLTLDLNINDKLNEELQSVIHKRMEEATRDIDANNDKSTKVDTGARSTDESFENFDNPDSEDEFDFVNVNNNDKDKSKSTPVLITSF